MIKQMAAAIAAAAALAYAQADAKWRELRTENFVIVTDSREEKAQEMAADLEVYRSALLRFFGLPDTPEPSPVPVLLHERWRMFNSDFDGIGGALGMYSASIHGPAFVAYVDHEHDGAIPAGWSIVKHEFVHHLVYSQSTTYFPRWYSEGFAEFLRTMRIEDGRAVIGAPPIERLHALDGGHWFGPELYEGTSSWKVGGRGPLYGQAWLTVHYLNTSNKYRGSVPDMLRAIDAGTTPREAMTSHLGITPEQLLAEVKAYWLSGELPVLHIPLEEGMADPVVRTRVIDRHEAAGFRQKVVGRFRIGRNGKRSDRWRQEHMNDLGRYLKGAPSDLEARYWIASHAAENDDEDALAEEIESMRAIAPDHALTQFALGLQQEMRARALATAGQGSAARDAFLEARTAFDRARTSDPAFGRAHFAFARTWLDVKDEVTQDAVSAIETADLLLGEAREVPFTYGVLLLRAGLAEEGRQILMRLKTFSGSKALGKRIEGAGGG